jgi:UMF1 family MFS transporter
MTLWPQKFGLADAGAAVRFAFLSVALWWGLFSVFTIVWLPEETAAPVSVEIKQIVLEGFRQFARTFKKIRHLKTIFLFLLAYWFYIDGVDTIIRMAVDYGLSIGFDANHLILALLIVQFVGFPAALLFGKLGQRWGARRAIFLAIGIYMLITLWGTMMRSPKEFYILAMVIGLVQGGIQALSRSYYSRLIPLDKAAEFYGFYNMLGKFAAIFGPAIIGIAGLTAKRILMPPAPTLEQMQRIGQTATRWGMASILILFIAGAILLYFVDEHKGKQEAEYLTEL